ncbi:MAG: hypothetical protein JWM32_3001 [Verrucomicrobia bacterium]|nr:hypothetical protein [Verrucomicrobiota bacterium]
MYKIIHKPSVFALGVAWFAAVAGGMEPADAGVRATPGKLREMSTDRPDATESPFTVDAGHVQVEMDFGNWTRDAADGTRTTGWQAAPLNLRFGLTSRFEAGIFIVPYLRVREITAAGAREIHSGAGDVTLRGKWNFTGNDGGTALGLIVDVKLPTAARMLGDGATEGTVLLPVDLELGGGWGLGAMIGMDVRLRPSGAGRRAVWINSVTAGHDLSENIGGYVEAASETGDGAQVATLDAGLVFKVGSNSRFDVGTEIGISRAAADLKVFTGWARRF